MVFNKRIIAFCGAGSVLLYGCEEEGPADCYTEFNFGLSCSGSECGWTATSNQQPQGACNSRCPDVTPQLKECSLCPSTIGTVYGTGCAYDFCETYASTKPSGSGVYYCSGMLCGSIGWVRNCTLTPPVVTCNTTTTEYSSCEQPSPISGIFNCLKTGPPPGSQPTSTKQTCTLTQCSNGTSTISDCYNTDPVVDNNLPR